MHLMVPSSRLTPKVTSLCFSIKSVDIDHCFVNSIGKFDLKSMVQLASPKGKCDLGVFKECAGQTANVINVGEGKVLLHFACGRVIEFSMSQHLNY